MHEWTGGEKAIPGIPHHPAVGVEVVDHLKSCLYDGVGKGEVAGGGGFGLAVFSAWRGRKNCVEVARG